MIYYVKTNIRRMQGLSWKRWIRLQRKEKYYFELLKLMKSLEELTTIYNRQRETTGRLYRDRKRWPSRRCDGGVGWKDRMAPEARWLGRVIMWDEPRVGECKWYVATWSDWREKWGEWWKIEGWGVTDTLVLVWAMEMHEIVEMTYWDVLRTKVDAIKTDKGGQ